jgi:NADH-quinone oxidoreductase subunit M
MFRMLQKVVWGGTNNPDQSYLTDLNVREIITLAPLLLFVLWIGLNPAPFMDVMHTSVSHLIQQVGIADVSQQGIFEVAKLAIPH